MCVSSPTIKDKIYKCVQISFLILRTAVNWIALHMDLVKRPLSVNIYGISGDLLVSSDQVIVYKETE